MPWSVPLRSEPNAYAAQATEQRRVVVAQTAAQIAMQASVAAKIFAEESAGWVASAIKAYEIAFNELLQDAKAALAEAGSYPGGHPSRPRLIYIHRSVPLTSYQTSHTLRPEPLTSSHTFHILRPVSLTSNHTPHTLRSVGSSDA